MIAEDERVLPIAQGDWVATTYDSMTIEIGRVRQSWWKGDEVLMNIVLYAASGATLGRTSPACGGPKSFEPAVLFDDHWQRIERPQFPLQLVDATIPCPDKPGWATMVLTYYHKGDGSLAPKPVRFKRRKRSGDYRRWAGVVTVEPSNLQEDIEVAALRRSAQELRDQSRHMPADWKLRLRERAHTLEAEADKIKPRFS
jgi:hypothetical protein